MNLIADINEKGFAIIPAVIDRVTIAQVISALERRERNAPGGGLAGIRNPSATIPDIARLAHSDAVQGLAERILGVPPLLVRSLLFDKQLGANWSVAWHQDITVAVRQRKEVAGFGAWSEKAGIVHAQAPASLLERMITVRVHLDECGLENGPLKVLPGSHLHGILDRRHIDECRRCIPERVCAVPSGGVLAMRPLLLHASAPAALPSHRRVVHLEFAATKLPGGLEWTDPFQGAAL